MQFDTKCIFKMMYNHIIFYNDKEVESFFDKLNEKAYKPLYWYKQDGLKIYGCFYADSIGSWLFVYGKTIYRDEVSGFPERSIFGGLKIYGSSKRYKGLLNFKGEVILHSNYDDISIFYQTEETLFLKTTKNGLAGLVGCRIYRGEVVVIVPTKYEELFDAGEYTIGFVLSGNVGFMSLEGKIVVEAKYKLGEGYNNFIDGKALVCITQEHAIDMYINHYGNFIEYPESDNTSSFGGQGTSTYPYGDLPDASEAYEDLPDAFWNTD